MKCRSTSYVALYLSIAFGLAWAIWIVEYLLFKVYHVIDLMGFLALSSVPMAGPAVGALAVALTKRRRRQGEAAKELDSAAIDAGGPAHCAVPEERKAFSHLSVLGYGLAGAVSVAAALLVSAIGLGGLLRSVFGLEVAWEPWGKFLLLWAIAIPLWMPMVFLEEVGWRGFLFRAWHGSGPLLSVFALGVLWALWHLPTFFFYGSFWFNLVCYLLFVPVLHFVEAWGYLKGKSLLVPILVHATYNAFALAIGGSGFVYTERMPYDMTGPSLSVKLISNLVFCLLLFPFAFLLIKEQRKRPLVDPLELARLRCDSSVQSGSS